MSKTEAWALIKAMPNYLEPSEEGNGHFINMNDVWGWACADGIEVTDENVERIAELYDQYGFGGLLYFQAGETESSEFHDNNRFLEFVRNEERIRKEVPDSNKRAYHKESYTIGALT